MSHISKFGCRGHDCGAGSTSRGRKLTRHPRNAHDNHTQRHNETAPHVVYVVTDTCYPSSANFDSGLGSTSIFSVHSSARAANEQAKKLIYETEDGCTVDLDKIIDQVKRGLYTGIGMGGLDGCCFARKCEVEVKLVDDSSEDEEDGESDGFHAVEVEREEENRGRKRKM